MKKQLETEIGHFKSQFVPFGSADIYRAVEVALEVGEDGDWAGEHCISLIEESEIPIDKLDVVCVVYETILQEARNEIEDSTGFDFCNDGAEIYVAGNYLATSFDWSGDEPQIIKNKLISCEITFEDLSKKTQWFLKEIEANYQPLYSNL